MPPRREQFSRGQKVLSAKGNSQGMIIVGKQFQSRLRNCQSGVSKLTTIFFGAIIAAALFTGYHVLPFYYYYFELQNQMESAVAVASTYSDKELREKLWYHVHRKMQIPGVKPEDIRIERNGGLIRISLRYQEIFFLTWKGKDYDIYVFKFLAKAEGKV